MKAPEGWVYLVQHQSDGYKTAILVPILKGDTQEDLNERGSKVTKIANFIHSVKHEFITVTNEVDESIYNINSHSYDQSIARRN